MAELIDGKKLARLIQDEIVADIGGLTRRPMLVAIAVGDDGASRAYTNAQAKLAAKLGIGYRLDTLPANTSQTEYVAWVRRVAEDGNVSGMMLQTPVPGGLDLSAARDAMPVDKDVEAVTSLAAGRLCAGTQVTAPCTALAAFHCLQSAVESLVGLDVCVIGRSDVVGKPLALLLVQAHATVTICHSRTADLRQQTRRAAAVVAAVGKPELIRGDMIAEGAVVIDVGTNVIADGTATRLVGDVCFAEVEPRAKALTPVPGGVGPVTVSMLMRNVVALARHAERRPDGKR